MAPSFFRKPILHHYTDLTSDVLLIFLYMVFYVIIPGMVSAIQAVSDTYDRSNSSERKPI